MTIRCVLSATSYHREGEDMATRWQPNQLTIKELIDSGAVKEKSLVAFGRETVMAGWDMANLVQRCGGPDSVPTHIIP